MSEDLETKSRVERLLTDSAMFIDRDELSAWLDCFEEESRYVVIPRENRARDYPVALIHCDNKARLEDRVTCLRYANKFNPHFDRHILSTARILSLEDGVAAVESNFMIVQTTKTGESKLFCAGCYEDRITVTGPRARFRERIVVLDTFSIPTLLATPI